MKQGIKFLGAAALAAFLAQPAQATVLFSDNFDGEGAPGSSVLNYTGFANWTVTGNVDLVSNGFGGVSCDGGAGKCVDLDGSPGPGRMDSISIAFVAGQTVTITIAVSGNQRGGNSDDIDLTVSFGAAVDVTDWTFFNGSSQGPLAGLVAYGSGFTLPSNSPWTIYTSTFLPTMAGSFSLILRTESADNIGPVLDNVLVTQGEREQVSEPATLALLGAGLLGLAAVRRRRA